MGAQLDENLQRPAARICSVRSRAWLPRYRLGATEIINASLVDEDYRPVNPVIKLEL